MTEAVDLSKRIGAVVGALPASLTELDGGAIGSVYRVDLPGERRLVAKVGDTPLAVEGFMLRYLATHSDLPVPTVYYASDDLLLLEFVPGESEVTQPVERDAADRLAALHSVEGPAFGFERDTLLGPLRQPNPWTDRWAGFFRDRRLLHAADAAREAGELPPPLHRRVRDVAADLDDLLVEPTAPTLLHGDAWTGNLLAGDGRVRAFLDPAIYFGHPKVELADLRWSETAGEPFFERYETHLPIADGSFEERLSVYALFPLLVHALVFGERYLDELAGTLSALGY